MSKIIALVGHARKVGARVEKHFIRLNRLDDESIIVDVGACVGDVIKDLRKYRQTKRCKIFAIECDKKNLEYLKKQNFSNLEICEKALVGQDTEGPIKFFRSPRGPNWGSIEPARLSERWASAEDSYYVKALKINDIFDEFGIDKIDYMKVDIEGAEKLIFDTMSMETAGKIKLLSMEVHWKNPHARITMDWAKGRLIELGFEVKHMERVEIFCERE